MLYEYIKFLKLPYQFSGKVFLANLQYSSKRTKISNSYRIQIKSKVEIHDLEDL